MHPVDIKGHFLFIYEAEYVPQGKTIHVLSWYHTSSEINAFHTCADDKSIGLSLDRLQTMPSFASILESFKLQSNPQQYLLLTSFQQIIYRLNSIMGGTVA